MLVGGKALKEVQFFKLEKFYSYSSLENLVTYLWQGKKASEVNLALMIPFVKQNKKNNAIFFGEKLDYIRDFVVCFKRRLICVLLGNQCLTEFVYTVIIQN